MFDLQCQDVTKNFGSLTAVSGVSLDIPGGSFFSILGPSGCGKTTLMRMIAGFEMPSAGDIKIKGKSVLASPPNKRNVKMVFQNLALFPMMNVGENIAYGLRCRGAGRAEIEEKVRDVLGRIGLPNVAHKNVNALSGGQRQRVAIARCMVLQPDVLLLDEPLGALDLKLREHMKIELKRLQQQFNTTFLYITHDQSEALVMSDNVAVMNAGKLEQVGTPYALYHQPSTGFVAGFVGDSNRWQGRVVSSENGVCRVEIEGEGMLVATTGCKFSTGDKVEVFVRPEAIAVDSSEAPEANNRLGGIVDNLLFNGANSRILIRTRSGLLVEADSKNMVDQLSLRVGDAVWISFSVERARCFAPTTQGI